MKKCEYAPMFRWYKNNAMLGGAFVSMMVLAAWLLAHSRGGVFARIRLIADWLGGGEKPAVVTWPAWGYAWLIALIPSYWLVIVLQSGLGALALLILVRRVRVEMSQRRSILIGLCILALPWYNLQTTLYPSAPAGSLALLALLSLDRALTANKPQWAALAGTFMGLAQNFRTEFVLLPAFLGIIVIVFR
jgi:hypothetical protein